jgi:hypothetical protein
MEREPMHDPTVNDALRELAGLESQLYATGAVDVESAHLASIRRDLLAGKLTPSNAIQSARRILEQRGDYH